MRTLLALGVACTCAFECGAADPPKKTDRYGDPLPSGAIVRYGTLRNRAPITGFGIEKDGTVVTVGPGADVRRWNPVDDKSDDPIALPVKGPGATAGEPQVSPDGKYVAAYSNKKLVVWETPADVKVTPKEVAAFALGQPRWVRFSPDGGKLIVTIWDRQSSTAHLCDIKSGKVTDLGGTASFFEDATFSGDGRRVAASAGYTFFLWDATTGQKLASYQTKARVAGGFALDRAGELVVSRSGFVLDDEWRFTDALTGKTRTGLSGPDGGVWVTFAPDDKALLVGDAEGVRWWDPVAGKRIRKFVGAAAGASANQRQPARFSPDGKILVAQTGAALLRWDAATAKPLFLEQDIGHGGSIHSVGVSADGKRVATRGMDNRVCVWDAASGKELSHAPASWLGSPDIDFSADGKFVYVGSLKWGELTKYDAETGKPVVTFTTDPKEPRQSSVYGARLSKDGKTVFGLTGPNTTSDPGFLTEWDAQTGGRLKTTRMEFGTTHGAELSPEATFIARGDLGRGGVVAVTAPEKNLLESAKIRGFSFRAGRFSDDGKWLTQLNMENDEGELKYTAVVISTLNWSVASTVPLAGSGPVALAPDGRTLAAAVGDDLVFYDCATSKGLGGHRLPAGHSSTNVLRFTPDGTKLITGHSDTTALVWAVPPRAAK